MNRTMIRHGLGAALAAAMLAAGGNAFAQADNTNSASDPTYYGSWYWWHPRTVAPRYGRDDDATRRVYIYGPTVTYRGPAFYDSWSYYNPPGVTYYTYPAETPLGLITDPAYMGPRDASR
jgi:hypothetical protein